MSPLRADYSGPFDPEVGLASFSRQALATLGREYLLERPPPGPRRPAEGGDPARHRAAGADLDRGVDGGEPDLLAAHAARARLRGQRRVDRVQEPPARHRRAAPVHGLPVPARPARVRRVLALALRRADGRRAVRRRARAPHVPRHRGPDLRRHRGRDASVHEDARRSTGRRASPRTATRTAAGRCSSTARASRSRSTRTSRSCRARRPRTCRSTCPRATASPAAGPTTRARSIPASSSKTSRTARS